MIVHDDLIAMSKPLTEQQLEMLKYPIGRRDPKLRAYTPEHVAELTAQIGTFSLRLCNEVQWLNDTHLDTPCQQGGWIVRQLTHHIADSHMNALIRFKWALSEDEPTIKPYKQDLWAEQAGARSMPVGAWLDIVSGVHARWVAILKSLTSADLRRGFVHPETRRPQDLAETLEIYA